jgi:hypothetical protein
MLWTRQVFRITVALCVLLSTLSLAGSAFAGETFRLNEPLLEDVPFCSEEQAVRHIASVIAKGNDPTRIHETYIKAGVCGQIAGAITYKEQVGKVGNMNIYKATLHKLTVYIATTWEHEHL